MIVFASHNRATSAVAQEFQSGALRVETTVESPRSPTEFRYSFGDGFRPMQDSRGSIWIVGIGASGGFEAYSVAPAWARDRNGSEVPTHYKVDGDELVQIVQPPIDAAYPLVADPTWQWFDAAYGAGFSKKETKTIAGSGAGAGFCAALPSALRVPCAVAAADWILQAHLAESAHGCVFIAAAPVPVALRWTSKECK